MHQVNTTIDTASEEAGEASDERAVSSGQHAPTAAPALAIDGTRNFRSVGGYVAAGGRVRHNALFRSDALHNLTGDGSTTVESLGIVRVIDLRSIAEVEWEPNVIPDSIPQLHHPIFEEATTPISEGALSLTGIYDAIALQHGDRLAEAVQLIADAPAGPVLVHCTAGKDRTGMVIAIALAAVGVPRDHIVADYAASGPNLAGEWADRMLDRAQHMALPNLDESVRELLLASPAAALEHALSTIDRHYGGARELLAAHGVDEAAVERLRERLLERHPHT